PSFLFTDPAHTDTYTLSLHDALPILREEIDAVLDLSPAFLVHMLHATDADLERCADAHVPIVVCPRSNAFFGMTPDIPGMLRQRSEEHTSELQSRFDLVCRLLLEKKK